MASRWLQISVLCYGSCRGHAARRGAATGPRACLPVTTAGDRAWDFADGGIRVLGRPPSDPAVLRQTGSMGETAFYPFLSGLGQPVAFSEGEGGPRSRCLAAPRAQRPSTPTHAQAGPSIRPTGRRSGKASSESEAPQCSRPQGLYRGEPPGRPSTSRFETPQAQQWAVGLVRPDEHSAGRPHQPAPVCELPA
jgi:hypothetical protein